ncbi:endonuclease/exonuclease/phosphatase family protein [Nodosilinea sp. LEGE 07088]|uniref:endonuclease/exonuclease/phosphatase family protein n=1 Tax=Nodosilinea sp. LEGE 07088 TaxID=2777968 RepID=UPI001881AF8E|nr:endonuclease/exonuclease/phosphatase family protein [Nodosilinea sp. LEGE 07088]MBE9137900.1 endonuclease/exonuclease/phosphatase family protein [Nodosilinea sp. LEGE 07088]
MATVFISEFHYDNAGTDVGEFIEVTASAGADLTGYSLVLYNGNGGGAYGTFALSGIVADQANGQGTFVVDLPVNGLQNGSPDGIALVDVAGNVVEFLSYEGEFTATDGPAAGLTSTDIGVSETGSEPAGQSLQRLNGTWTGPASATKGSVNGAGNGGGGGGLTSIGEIQGAGHTSPLVGQAVVTTGVVTAVDTNGFYLQDPVSDDDLATSDAIFVFTSSAPGVAVGDELRVEGTVSEFTPGGASTRNLSTTQISGTPTLTVLSTGNALPAATILGAGGRVPPTENIDDDAFGSFDPETDGIDFFESLEGMRVTAQDFLVVNGTNRFGEIFGVVDNGAGATGLSDRGTLNISPDDFNPERVQIQFDSGVFDFAFPDVSVGDRLGDVTGVVGYGFGNFEIVATADFSNTLQAAGLSPEVSPLTSGDDQLTVASYNVLNLDPNDSDGDTDIANGRFAAIAQQIVNNLNSPDIIGLQEVQDNSGGTDDGVTAADVTLQTLVDAIAAAGGPTYAFIDNTFITDNASGGQPGANIRTAYLYDPSRVNLVEGSVATIGGQGSGEAFAGARLPLVASFEFNGETVTLVNNHFSSKGGSAPILGTEQPFEARQEEVAVNGSLDERQAQSLAVQNYVNGLVSDAPGANVVVLGDFNEFEFVSPVKDLAANTGLTNLTETLPENERYSFIFQGNSQSLDHILVSEGLAAGAEFDAVHVNAEFAETDGRASDHDPLLARFTFETALNEIVGTNGRDVLIGTDSADRIEGRRGLDTLIGGAGDDILLGGRGIDLLTGGEGRDTFVYEAVNEGLDIIRDFNPAEDVIDLRGIFSGANYGSDTPFEDYVNLISFGFGNTTVTVDPNGDRRNLLNRPLVTLEGVTPGMLSTENFLV